MKTLKIIAIAIISVFILNTANAQNDTIRIKTSAICDQCKERIENDLSFEKGVKTINFDLKDKVVMVVYNAKKTDAQTIRIAITKIGYDADSLKADPKSFSRLPDCCKNDGKHH